MISEGDGADLLIATNQSPNSGAPPISPDWRWRYCVARIGRLECSCDPEVFFAGPAADELLSDPVMTDYLYPYLRHRLGCGETRMIEDEVMVGIDQALEAANELMVSKNCWSLRLEAGVLARRPVGEVMPPCDDGVSRLGQIVYERLFFDVRAWLAEPVICAALLCANPDRLRERGTWDFQGKVIAYILGFDEFEKWRLGTPSRAATSLCRDVEYDLLYLDGLRVLGLERPDDLAVALGRRLSTAVTGMVEDTDGGHGASYSSAEIARLMRLVPANAGKGGVNELMPE